MSEFFSSWTLIRASGFLAYYFLTLSLAIGLMGSLPMMKKRKAILVSSHQASGWYGLLTVLFHILLIWQDQYVPYSLTDLFLPFRAQNEPFYSALGTLSFYLFLLVIVSSDFIKKIGRSTWKKVHFSVILAWILMLIHGLAIGTDTSKPWALVIYLVSGFLIIGLLLLRFMETAMTRQQPEQHPLKR